MKKSEINRVQTSAFKYRRMLEERRGGNFEYWSTVHDDLLENGGYDLAKMSTAQGEKLAVYSCDIAKAKVNELRDAGNFARIIAGYERNAQRRKTYSVIFKPRKRKR